MCLVISSSTHCHIPLRRHSALTENVMHLCLNSWADRKDNTFLDFSWHKEFSQILTSYSLLEERISRTGIALWLFSWKTPPLETSALQGYPVCQCTHLLIHFFGHVTFENFRLLWISHIVQVPYIVLISNLFIFWMFLFQLQRSLLLLSDPTIPILRKGIQESVLDNNRPIFRYRCQFLGS